MSHTHWFHALSRRARRRAGRKAPRPARLLPDLQALEDRKMPTVSAVFAPATATLMILGDNLDNVISVGRNTAGAISINGGAVKILGGKPTVANTSLIQIFSQGGNDQLRLDETNGAMPASAMFGASGNDTLIGGSAQDALHGQEGDDVLNGGAGDDFLLGQSGDDVMSGGDGVDTMFGGSGDDTADGDRGDDVAFLAEGDDQFIWDPGDGSDRVEGESGYDTMLFNGSGADEKFELSANGPRLRFTRDVANIVMDVDGVESVSIEALGGADTVTQNDLTGTAVQEIAIDLEAAKDGGVADDKVGSVILNGTDYDDFIDMFALGGKLFVFSPTFVTIERAAASDKLTINALGGDDRIEASGVPAGVMSFTFDGGSGDDDLAGTGGADVLIGGAGDDFVDGQGGDDVAYLGSGDDIFFWTSGDGSDRIEGEAGRDSLVASGSVADEVVSLSAAGDRFRFTRDVDDVTLDAGGLETFSFFSFGGSDQVVVNDLTGTGVDAIDISLFDFGVPGGAEDVVIVNGTSGDDAIAASSDDGKVAVAGLAAELSITGTDAAGDRLVINGLGGDDAIDATELEPAEMQLQADGGSGSDVLAGTDGDDLLIGGDDDDVLIGGDGDDAMFGEDGDDALNGGDGSDVLFAGSDDNVAFGGDGDDVLRGEEGDDVLDGGDGDDILIGNAGDDVLLNGEVVFDD